MFFSSKKSIDVPQVDIIYSTDRINEKYLINDETLKNNDIIDINHSDENNENNENIDINHSDENNSSVTNGDIDDIDIDDDDEDDDDEDDDIDGEFYDEEDCLFIISIDGVPSYYEEKIINAKNRIDKVSKLHSLNDYGYHETHIKYISDTEIDIIRNYDFYLFSINHVMHKFKIFKIKKCL